MKNHYSFPKPKRFSARIVKRNCLFWITLKANICFHPVVYSKIKVGPCDHKLCINCMVKMTLLLQRKKCPVCNSIFKEVYSNIKQAVISTNTDESYKNIVEDCKKKVYGFLVADYIKSNVTKFLSKYYKSVCNICNCAMDSLNKFLEHSKNEHNILYCQQCIKYKKIFLYEQETYNFHELSNLS